MEIYDSLMSPFEFGSVSRWGRHWDPGALCTVFSAFASPLMASANAIERCLLKRSNPKSLQASAKIQYASHTEILTLPEGAQHRSSYTVTAERCRLEPRIGTIKRADTNVAGAKPSPAHQMSTACCSARWRCGHARAVWPTPLAQRWRPPPGWQKSRTRRTG